MRLLDHWPLVMFSRRCARCGLRKRLFEVHCDRCQRMGGW